ncbi:MAG: Appr-1-p processing protein [Acidobacteria bacterium]|nr:Appr-1-p processing protein [Acidobacteriota bacterium]
MITFISGDILRANTEFVALGVATGAPEGGGAAGAAAKVSSKWPEVQQHLRQFTRGNKFQGGDLFVVAPGKNRPGVIFMAALSDAEHVSASFLNRALRKLARYCIKHKVASVALPKIEAGVDWEDEVKPLLEKFLEGERTEFYVYED